MKKIIVEKRGQLTSEDARQLLLGFKAYDPEVWDIWQRAEQADKVNPALGPVLTKYIEEKCSFDSSVDLTFAMFRLREEMRLLLKL